MLQEAVKWLWSFFRAGINQYTLGCITALFALYVVHWIRQRRYKQSLFSRLGIPHVKPHLIYGSFDSLRREDILAVDMIGEWRLKYGNIYGYYVGENPYLVVSDLDLVKQVLVKDFHTFSNRPKLVIEAQPVVNTVVGLRDQRWKDVRSVLAPTFSMVKMKKMSGIMNTRVNELLDIISEKSSKDQSMEFYSLFQGLTLDVISECVLAMKTNCQRDQDKDELFSAVRGFLRNAINPAIRIAIYFNVFGKVMSFISNQLALSGRMTNMIVDHLKTVLAIRRNDLATKYIDVLQLMLEAADNQQPEVIANGNQDLGLDEQIPNYDTDNHITNANSPSPSLSSNKDKILKKNLTDDEIIANAWVFLLAGFETTANSLTSTAYLLALNSDVQEKLYQELSDNIEDATQPLSYETVNKLPYLDQVFSEALRIYPPVVTFISRENSEDYQLGDYLIPKHTNIMIPIWQLHRDPELWPEPETFDPERFAPNTKAAENRHPMSYLPFGAGPRSCVGVRFAQLEAKLTLARLIRNFRLETCDETPIPLDFEMPTVTLIPSKGVMLKATPRE